MVSKYSSTNEVKFLAEIRKIKWLVAALNFTLATAALAGIANLILFLAN